MRHRLRKIGRWLGGVGRRDRRESGGRIFECTWWCWMVLRWRGRVGLGRSAAGGVVWIRMVLVLVDATLHCALCNGYRCTE
ncbi:hypothetical protein BDW71DRAFT_184183 [Aspergillus fruticulosus]